MEIKYKYHCLVDTSHNSLTLFSNVDQNYHFWVKKLPTGF